jgi:NADH:ubiquinone oxidoreductase subunit K
MIPDPLAVGVIGVAGLLAIGFYGLLLSRNLIKLVIAMQLLVKAAVLALVLAGRANGQIGLSQSLAITVIVADTVVAVIAMALAVQVRRRIGTLDATALAKLKG